MKMLISLTLLSLATLKPVYAEEGFFTTPLKGANLAKAWTATVAIMAYSAELNRDRLSTGFVAKQQTVKGKYYLFIVVSRRAMEANNGSSDGLNGIRFYNDIKWDLVGKYVGQPLPFTTRKTETSNSVDLGGYWVETDADAYKKFNPLMLQTGCKFSPTATHYLIGFPAIMDRPGRNQTVRIEDATTIEKRWSKGELTPKTLTVPEADGVRIGSTADSMKGSSGAPAVMASGAVIGVQVAGWAGVVYKSDFGDASYLVKCKDLKEFLNGVSP